MSQARPERRNSTPEDVDNRISHPGLQILLPRRRGSLPAATLAGHVRCAALPSWSRREEIRVQYIYAHRVHSITCLLFVLEAAGLTLVSMLVKIHCELSPRDSLTLRIRDTTHRQLQSIEAIRCRR
jgi:hypothetical protein